jgi:hypothetical protein
MQLERAVHTDVRALLIGTDTGNGNYANEPFQYAHLVKFERPSQLDARSGKASTSAQRYTYITDGSRDVSWDDGSYNLNGVPNGAQKYIANKLLAISDVQEAIEAKASNFTITLDGNGLGASVTGAVTVTVINTTTFDIAFPASIDPVASGFREGDKVLISGARAGNFNINSFRANNVVRVTQIDVTDTMLAGSALNITMDLSSEEIKSILMDKANANYVSFINREVFIYRAYFQDGVMIGEAPDANGIRGPILLFKGIISAAAFEDQETGIKIQWTLTSHWGDFAQVKGRVTSDGFHRALDHNGKPNPDSAIKPIYAYDKGFIHAETSINLLATYTVQVEKQKVKAKNGFLGLGIGSKVKVKKYYVNEDRNTELDFQLAAKSIPVIYGVRNTGGIPIFADTKKTDSSDIYVVYALCEGQIGGLYDIYVDGKSLICNDAADSAARSSQTEDEVVEVLCRGRADRGDVLGGSAARNTLDTPVEYYSSLDSAKMYAIGRVFGLGLERDFRPHVQPSLTATVSNVGSGITHEQTINLSSPQQIDLVFYSGTENQKANGLLVDISKNNNFKVQADYWENGEQSQADYWGPNHRLLDTAYVVAHFKIKEGETSIPEIEYIIRGKSINCYNYDYSYSQWAKATGQNSDNFKLGATVTLYNTATGVALPGGASVQIIDKWTIIRADGTKDVRFRWSIPPNLGYVNGVPTITKFHMSDGINTWTMSTYNHIELSGTVQAMSSTPTITDTGGSTTVNLPAGSDLLTPGTSIQLVDTTGTQLENEVYRDSLIRGTPSGTSIVSLYSFTKTNAGLLV